MKKMFSWHRLMKGGSGHACWSKVALIGLVSFKSCLTRVTTPRPFRTYVLQLGSMTLPLGPTLALALALLKSMMQRLADGLRLDFGSYNSLEVDMERKWYTGQASSPIE